jgi:hypothetical protein
MPITRKPVVEMDVTGDYVRSYGMHTETSSRLSNSGRQRGGTGREGLAIGREVAGKAGDEEGYLGTERRQDKAAGQMPVRSVSTPRWARQLCGAPHWARRCTSWNAVSHAIRTCGQAKSAPRAVQS